MELESFTNDKACGFSLEQWSHPKNGDAEKMVKNAVKKFKSTIFQKEVMDTFRKCSPTTDLYRWAQYFESLLQKYQCHAAHHNILRVYHHFENTCAVLRLEKRIQFIQGTVGKFKYQLPIKKINGIIQIFNPRPCAKREVMEWIIIFCAPWIQTTPTSNLPIVLLPANAFKNLLKSKSSDKEESDSSPPPIPEVPTIIASEISAKFPATMICAPRKWASNPKFISYTQSNWCLTLLAGNKKLGNQAMFIKSSEYFEPFHVFREDIINSVQDMIHRNTLS